MIALSLTRPQKLVTFVTLFAEASAAHKQALAMAERATALDLALERDAAKHGIGFDEIVFEALNAEQCQ